MEVVSARPLGLELGADGQSSLCIRPATETPARLRLAFRAARRGQVEAFHRAALEAGATDHGAPGLRPEYSGRYFAAFVIGPDGHNIEVACHEAEG